MTGRPSGSDYRKVRTPKLGRRLSGRWALLCALTLCLSYVTLTASADSIRIAVASNFSATARSLISEFERVTGHAVTLLVGSTGKHLAQIHHGLPVDVFLAADDTRPKYLEAQGLAISNTRFTYAIGRLAFWSAQQAVDETTLLQVNNARIAIANAKLAPYGLAAEQTLSSLGYLPALTKNLVRGESVAQAYQFVRTENARFGFVALSQLKNTDEYYWLVPAQHHQAIEQQVILLNDSVAGRRFLRFLRSADALALIERGGYDRPQDLP